MNIILLEQLPHDLTIAADDPRAKHILKVLRLGVGDSFDLGIINGPSGIATIESVADGTVRFAWQEQLPAQKAMGLYDVTLLVGQVRPICMKRILREAVSLGVSHIVAVGTDTSEKSYQDAGLYRNGEYRQHLLDGAMQAAATGVSDLTLYATVDQAMGKVAKDGVLLLMLDNVTQGEPLSLMVIAKDTPVVLAIGPERGWSDRERQLLVDNGFVPASLGKRVLRTETACSAGLGVLLGRMGLL